MIRKGWKGWGVLRCLDRFEPFSGMVSWKEEYLMVWVRSYQARLQDEWNIPFAMGMGIRNTTLGLRMAF